MRSNRGSISNTSKSIERLKDSLTESNNTIVRADLPKNLMENSINSITGNDRLPDIIGKLQDNNTPYNDSVMQ